MIEVDKVSGIGEYETENLQKKVKFADVDRGDGGEKYQNLQIIYKIPGGKAFLVDRGNTIEVRSERNLANLLREKYESVMESRYFGKGGIEVVMSGQLSENEVEDLVRLSYNLTRELE